MKFCCKYMNMALEDCRTSTQYGTIFTAYYLKSKKDLMIDYCPWCGVMLPKNLRVDFAEASNQRSDMNTTRTNGLKGSKEKFYQWDDLHKEIEMYDYNGKPIDTLDPVTGKMKNKDVIRHKILKL